MTDFNLILSQVRQRLEILYQMVDDIETSGGGGGGTGSYTDLTDKPKINSVTLSGNKSSSDLGLASTSDLESKADASNVYTKSEVYTKAETAAEIGAAIADIDVPAVGGSTKYIKSVSQADGAVVAEAGNIDTAPASTSSNLITSGGVYTALYNTVTAYELGTVLNPTEDAPVDLNDLTTPGMYRTTSGGGTFYLNNKPDNTQGDVSGRGATIIVQYAGNTNYIRQTYIPGWNGPQADKFFVRHFRGPYSSTDARTGWSNWYVYAGTELVPASAQTSNLSPSQLSLTNFEPDDEDR